MPYVLLVNEFDELDHIEDCLAVLRGLGKADTIALAFIARQRQILEGVGRPITRSGCWTKRKWMLWKAG